MSVQLVRIEEPNAPQAVLGLGQSGQAPPTIPAAQTARCTDSSKQTFLLSLSNPTSPTEQLFYFYFLWFFVPTPPPLSPSPPLASRPLALLLPCTFPVHWLGPGIACFPRPSYLSLALGPLPGSNLISSCSPPQSQSKPLGSGLSSVSRLDCSVMVRQAKRRGWRARAGEIEPHAGPHDTVRPEGGGVSYEGR